MATGIPLEDGYEATLTQALAGDSGALTIYVSKTPVFTFPSGQEVCFTINPKKGFSYQENVLVESYDATAKTLTVKTGGRAANRYNGDSPTPLSHAVGSKIIISDAYPVWNSLDDYVSKAGDTMTGPLDFSGASATLRLPNLTEAQRDALASPANGMKIFNTTAGEEQVYNGGSWYTVAAGSTQPDASETVAGKVEQATLAEQIAKTETGTTGAPLFLNPKNTAITSADAAEGKLVQLNSSKQVDSSLLAGGSVTISLPAGEAVDGSTTPQLVAISDGTNGKTSGAFYKADSDDTTNMLVNSIGFVNVNAATPGTSYNVITNGIVDGFTGLTVGASYFNSATAGEISLTPPATGVVQKVGWAISETQLLIDKGLKQIYATYAPGAISAAETVDTELTIGIKPLMVFAGVKGPIAGVGSSGSSGMWVQGGVSFSLENKGTGVEDSGSTGLFGNWTTNLCYFSTMNRTTDGNYMTLTLSVNAVSATSITIRRVVTLAGSTSINPTIYLHIIGT
jgi:hypothetical protein